MHISKWMDLFTIMIIYFCSVQNITLCLKKWGTHIVLHNSHKNCALWIKFGTVNRKSISYNLPLKLLMQQSTSCGHCHDNHWAHATEYLHQVTPEFILPDLWPPNSPDLNPVDYTVWGCLQGWVYQKRICDIDELKQCLVEVWSHFSQAIIDEAINEWRKRLLACIRMKAHHFEHFV